MHQVRASTPLTKRCAGRTQSPVRAGLTNPTEDRSWPIPQSLPPSKALAREVRLIFGFALLNIVVSMSVGAIVSALTNFTPNGSTAQLGHLDVAERIAFFAKTLPQLLGEEVMTLLPFLALLQWFSKGLGGGRKGAIVGAWLTTSVLFGLIHLPTYGWNWIQCIVVIGSARMVLTLPWILTKNIWVSTGAHIVNDWLLFTMTMLGAGLVRKG
jgi:membrane protease YdiL (CAAX protease family)